MLAHKDRLAGGWKDQDAGDSKIFCMALELLKGCGMIFRARLLRSSLADGRCHPADRDLQSPL